MVKSQKRKGAKRAMVSKGRRMRKTLNVNKSLTPFSQRYITKMKYSENVITGSTGVYRFALNNLFDPNLTGVGHQPHRLIVTGKRSQ
jgi:uridine kinase